MPSSDQEVEVVDTWRFVLDQDEKQVDGQSHQDLLLSLLVNGTKIRKTIPRDIIGNDRVDQTHEQVLAILRPLVGEISVKRVQNKQVLVWRIKQGLTEDSDRESKKVDPVFIIGVDVVV